MLARTILAFLLIVGGTYFVLFGITNAPWVKNKERAKKLGRHVLLFVIAIALTLAIFTIGFSLEQS